MDNQNFISKYGVFVTVVVTVVGTGIFSYPSQLSERVGTDSWIVILLSGVIEAAAIYLTYKAIKANNYARFLDILHNNFGNILGNILAVFIAYMGVIIIGLQMRVFTEVTKMYLLESTPTEFMLLVMILVGTYLIRGELESVIKFNEVVFWLMFIPILLSIPFMLKGAEFTNILPVFTHEPVEYIKSISTGFFSFLGFGIIYMLFPFAKDKNKLINVTFKSLGFVVGFYLIVVMVSLMIFSKQYNAQLLWPSISMISIVDIPGAFVERWEGVAMAFWLLFYFTTYVNIYYFSAEIIRDVFHLEDIKISLMLIIPFIYAAALYPQSVAEVYDILKNKILLYTDAVFIVTIPIILLAIAFFKTRRVKNE